MLSQGDLFERIYLLTTENEQLRKEVRGLRFAARTCRLLAYLENEVEYLQNEFRKRDIDLQQVYHHFDDERILPEDQRDE